MEEPRYYEIEGLSGVILNTIRNKKEELRMRE